MEEEIEIMKLGMFGGSFNPPHNGHVVAAKEALRRLSLDLLLWVPTGSPPHKTLPPGSPRAERRFELCRLAVQGIDRMEVCGLEIEQKTRYTIDTVQALLTMYNPAELWLCLGGDMFLTLQH